VPRSAFRIHRMQQRILPLTDGAIVPHAQLEAASGRTLPPVGKTLKLRLSLLLSYQLSAL